MEPYSKMSPLYGLKSDTIGNVISVETYKDGREFQWEFPLYYTDLIQAAVSREVSGAFLLLQFGRLFHSPLAQPQRQAICLPLGLCKGTVSGLWKWWQFPPVTWALGTLQITLESSGVEVSPSLYLDQPITILVTSANGRPCLIIHWQSYSHQGKTV